MTDHMAPPSSAIDPTTMAAHEERVARISELDDQLTSLHSRAYLNTSMYNTVHRVADTLLEMSATITNQERLIKIETVQAVDSGNRGLHQDPS
jgi:hypothetical protein